MNSDIFFLSHFRIEQIHDEVPGFVFSLGNQESEDLELDDQDLLASLEAQEEVERPPVRPVRDSGYRTLSEPSTQSSRSSSVRSLISSASSRWVVDN